MTDAPVQGKQEVLTAAPERLAEMLASRAIMLAATKNRRVVIGIAGGPGTGKSTLAANLVGLLGQRIDGSAARVPMDGFHLPHEELEKRDLVEKKGAPETFDGVAFVKFLRALRVARGPVSVPSYSRSIEDVVPDAFKISGNVPIIIVEGNYLLLPTLPWREVKPLLDLSVFIDVPRIKVITRLTERHAEHGLFTEEHIRNHIQTVDLPNYDLVLKTMQYADILARLEVRG